MHAALARRLTRARMVVTGMAIPCARWPGGGEKKNKGERRALGSPAMGQRWTKQRASAEPLPPHNTGCGRDKRRGKETRVRVHRENVGFIPRDIVGQQLDIERDS